MKYSIILLCAVCLVSCGGRSASRQKRASGPSVVVPYGYKIVNSYPHDTGAYTQGLCIYLGEMYESTGEYGHSSLRHVELETGNVLHETKLSDDYFAEGMTILDGLVYQLTWQEGKAFVYNARDFEATQSFEYRGEGWGLTTDGEKLYMSDGTPNITVRDPATFDVERTVVVRQEGRAVQFINELEWIDGKIWANVYMTDDILIIDPASGTVEGIIDFSGIAGQLALTYSTDVMNGIACDTATGRIFVTGKRWDKLFEIEIFKK
jgi:glutamine cyclotransferase